MPTDLSQYGFGLVPGAALGGGALEYCLTCPSTPLPDKLVCTVEGADSKGVALIWNSTLKLWEGDFIAQCGNQTKIFVEFECYSKGAFAIRFFCDNVAGGTLFMPDKSHTCTPLLVKFNPFTLSACSTSPNCVGSKWTATVASVAGGGGG